MVYNYYNYDERSRNMKYIINAAAMATPFFVPAQVVDEHIRLATGNQLKVLLCMLKNISSGANETAIAEFLRLPEAEVLDALEFWAQAGLLTSVDSPAPKKESSPKPKAVKPVTVKPTREEVAEIAVTDDKLAFMLQEAEMKLGRSMRAGEIQNLAWLYLDHDMDVSIILMLVEYAVSEGKTTVAFIESTALAWLDAGVSSLAEAEEQIEARNRKKTAWGLIQSVFGIDRRSPSDKELEYARKWVVEWGFTREMLREAYNRCVDQKAKLDMRYINGILERWHKEGITSPAQISEGGKKTDDSMARYDKDLVKTLLNKDD